ncbi:MAG: hypothetical protein AAFV53_28000 [Myxococcota bacterium]
MRAAILSPLPYRSSPLLAGLFAVVVGSCTYTDPTPAKIRDAWNVRPEVVPDMLKSIRNPIERVALITELIEAKPEKASLLCPKLEDGPARERCTQMARRPHLWSEAPRARFLKKPPRSDLSGVPAISPSDCIGDAEPHACADREAIRSARAGNLTRAAGICMGLNADTRWKQECAFRAAEELAAVKGSDAYADIAGLCLLTGTFAGSCFVHADLESTNPPPKANNPDPLAWSVARHHDAEIARYWDGRDPSFGRDLRLRFWSTLAEQSYTFVHDVTGDPLDQVPEIARPAIEAAAALRLLELNAGRDLLPAQQEDALRNAMVSRFERGRKPLQPVRSAPKFRRLVALAIDEEGWIPYGPTEHRPTDADPEIDRWLSLLEAAARLDPPAGDLLRAGERHPSLTVQASAARLRSLMQTAPEAVASRQDGEQKQPGRRPGGQRRR